MLMSLVLTLMFMSARHVIGKWSALLAVQLNGFIGVLVAPLVTLGTLRCLIASPVRLSGAIRRSRYFG